MTSFNRNTVYAIEHDAPNRSLREEFFNDVISGLAKFPKELPCKYFYDERGSILFTQICSTDDYYVTRTEAALMVT